MRPVHPLPTTRPCCVLKPSPQPNPKPHTPNSQALLHTPMFVHRSTIINIPGRFITATKLKTAIKLRNVTNDALRKLVDQLAHQGLLECVLMRPRADQPAGPLPFVLVKFDTRELMEPARLQVSHPLLAPASFGMRSFTIPPNSSLSILLPCVFFAASGRPTGSRLAK